MTAVWSSLIDRSRPSTHRHDGAVEGRSPDGMVVDALSSAQGAKTAGSQSDKLVPRPGLHQAPAIHDVNDIGVADRREPMRDDDDGHLPVQLIDRALNARFV